MARLVAALCLLLAAAAAPAHAERRVALVIGNSAYANVSRLPNARNDAEAVAAMLRGARFDVVELKADLGIRELRRAVGDFAEVVRDADIAVVYFAAHGIEVDGVNYLIPVDAKLARDFDVEDEAMALDRVVRAVDHARKLRLVILDACRDNPFLKTMKRSLGTRSLGRGLAKVEPAAADTLIAFSAKAGSVALDGEGPNSPFTAALLKHFVTPGLDVRIAFGRVRDDVLAATRRAQEPFVYGSLGGRTIALVEKVPVARARPTAPAAAATVPLRESLLALIALGVPAREAARRERTVGDYEKLDGPKVIALAPSRGTWTRSRNEGDVRVLTDETLEGCQIFYGQPCALLAVNDAIVSDASGNWRLQDMARVRYAGTFDPERLPASRLAARDRTAASYAAAVGAKAVVLHPRGLYYYESGHPDQRTAEERAFARCDADPRRGGKDPPCYLYASGNQVVLSKRVSKAGAQP